jgi:predicted metal-dependent enzyme (double-stranded beta helix superfamily)
MATNAFGDFIEDVELLRRAGIPSAALVPQIAIRLAALNQGSRWLPADARAPVDIGYAQHLLYAADDGGLSVCSLVWKAGQCTPIHNHVAWCVVGVYEGVERETRYRLAREGESAYLVESHICDVPAGEAAGMLPDGDDIHCVANGGDCIAISIHVYGADLRTLGSSIRSKFDHLPVRREIAVRP